MEKRRVFMSEYVGRKLNKNKLEENHWTRGRGFYYISYDSRYNPPSGPYRLNLNIFQKWYQIHRISIRIQRLYYNPPDIHWYEIEPAVDPDPLDQDYAKKLIEEVLK